MTAIGIMRQALRIVAMIAALFACATAQAPVDAAFKQLYDGHRIFELRDAMDGRDVPALYAGAVASAFNHVDEAEKSLNQAIRDASTNEEANEAREWLIELYMRLGRSSDAVRVIYQALKAAPSRSDLQNARRLLDPIARYPNQTVRAGRREAVSCVVNADGVVLPLSVNGKTVSWLLDTGFNMSALSEAEARMLGLPVHAGTAQTEDFAGGTAPARTAVAPRVTIGGTELRNVPMLVFPDSQPPWNEFPAGRRGTIGLPMALALETVAWTSNGVCHVGPTPSRGDTNLSGNLAFDRSTPLTRVRFEGRSLDFVLDTGNQGGTQLWARFAREFSALVSEQGRQGTRRVSQIGGSSERDVIVLPEARLLVGGLDAVLRPANIFSPPIGNDMYHGNLGMDVLSQAVAVTIDFQSMSLTLR